MSTHVYRDDGFRAGSDRRLRQFWIEAVSYGIHIHQNRQGIGKENGAGGRDKREIGHDHFIARPYVQRSHGDFQRGRPIRDSDPVTRAVVFRKCLFKLQSLSAWRAPPHSALENFVERSALIVVVLRPERKRLLFGSVAAEQREFRHVFSLIKLCGSQVRYRKSMEQSSASTDNIPPPATAAYDCRHKMEQIPRISNRTCDLQYCQRGLQTGCVDTCGCRP